MSSMLRMFSTFESKTNGQRDLRFVTLKKYIYLGVQLLNSVGCSTFPEIHVFIFLELKIDKYISITKQLYFTNMFQPEAKLLTREVKRGVDDKEEEGEKKEKTTQSIIDDDMLPPR